MRSDAAQLYDRLQSHGLERYFPNLTAHGITHVQELAQIAPKTLSAYGIHAPDDYRQMSLLVQKIVSESQQDHHLVPPTPSGGEAHKNLALSSGGMTMPLQSNHAVRLSKPM